MLKYHRSCQPVRGIASLLSIIVPLLLILLAPLARGGAAELGTLSIEDLMEIEVTSVSKRVQPLSEAAAAVHVSSMPARRS